MKQYIIKIKDTSRKLCCTKKWDKQILKGVWKCENCGYITKTTNN